MPVLIGMRCLQAIGSSAVISVGAGSLADMYEVHERGQKVSLSLLSTTKTTQDE
jgi:MFS family permease